MNRNKVYDAVQRYCDIKDLVSATQYLLDLASGVDFAVMMQELVTDCYYQAKSIQQVVYYGLFGIHSILTFTKYNATPDGKRECLRKAKAIATNIASFTWPGWDEEGIHIYPAEMAIGLSCAKYSVQQLEELDPTSDQRAFTNWFLGAQLLAHGKYKEATEVMELCAKYSESAVYKAMLRGYIEICRVLENSDYERSGFDTCIHELIDNADDDGRFFAKQLTKAFEVFLKRSSL